MSHNRWLIWSCLATSWLVTSNHTQAHTMLPLWPNTHSLSVDKLTPTCLLTQLPPPPYSPHNVLRFLYCWFHMFVYVYDLGIVPHLGKLFLLRIRWEHQYHSHSYLINTLYLMFNWYKKQSVKMSSCGLCGLIGVICWPGAVSPLNPWNPLESH